MRSTHRLGVIWLAFGVALMAVLMLSVDATAQTVVNGDFETGTELFVAWPGYTGFTNDAGTNPAEIVGWTSVGQTGINPVVPGGAGDAPFRDNGNNDTSVALLQGAASIEQTVAGFSIGQEYVLSLDFNSRDCCGDVPLATISLNGQVAGSSTDLFPEPGGVPPVGGSEPWHHADIPFTAPTTDVTVLISSAPLAGGDATLVVDNVSFSVVPEPATGLLAAGALLSLVCAVRRRK